MGCMETKLPIRQIFSKTASVISIG